MRAGCLRLPVELVRAVESSPHFPAVPCLVPSARRHGRHGHAAPACLALHLRRTRQRLCYAGSTSRRGSAAPVRASVDRVPPVRVPPVAPERRDWFADNNVLVRAAPLYLGAAAVLALVLNRLLSGEALATDASTAQSRAEVIVLALSTALVLTARH